MVIRRLIGRTDNRTVTTERIKLLAGGCQLIAVGTFVSSIVAPIFNQSIAATGATHAMGGLGFAIFELLAMRVMGYLPSSEET